MPRFNFPLPGRRPKQQGPSVPPSRNKAQKLLGSTDYNLDSQPPLPTDVSRNWETRSSSGMSISISESTVSEEDCPEDFHDDHHHDGGLSSLTEGEVVNTTTPRQQHFDEESGVLGRGDPIYPIYADLHHSDRRSATDASSLRRRLSSSTIMSYYDKSKVPLVISQQTSNSAMAKGLPPKAQSLLDIDGTISRSGSINRKKPARLDLSHLIPTRRSSILATSAAKSTKRLVLGPDMVTRSPSMMSASPLDQSTRPITSRPTTRASVQEPVGPPHGPLPQPPSLFAPAMQQPSDLQSLYDHYERMSVRDVYEQDEEIEQEPMSYLSEPTPPAVKSLSATFLSPYAGQAARISTMLRNDVPVRSASQSSLPATHSLHSLVPDCSASISSRNTRTSRASRNSLMNVDLQQTSILSLSSDSDEEEFFDLPQTSSGYSSQISSEDALAREQWHSSVPGSQAQEHESYYYASPASENNSEPASVFPRTAATRFSNASLATNSTARPSTRLFRHASTASRTSLVSNNTIQSFGQDSCVVQEAKTVTMVPVQSGVRHPPQPYDMSHLNQPTPPLSPTSADLYYHHVHHDPRFDADERSVRSGRSLGSLASLSTAASSRSNSSPNSQSRFMAVTRQEEKLLAALRMKKARMRESIIAEFEEEQEETLDFPSGVYQPKVSPRSHRTTTSRSPELHAPKPRLANRNSINFPLHIGDGPASPLSTRSPLRQGTHSRQASSVLSEKYGPTQSAYEEGSSGMPSPVFTRSFNNRNSHNKQPSMQSAMAVSDQYDDDYYSAEPSPDLSDFLDFDDGVSYESPAGPSPLDQGSVNRQSTHFLLPPAATDRVRQAASYQPRNTKSKRHSRALDEEVRVHIVDDPIDPTVENGLAADNMAEDVFSGIPRPDSPVEAPLPLPRKKAIRISAVGLGMEQALWGHDG